MRKRKEPEPSHGFTVNKVPKELYIKFKKVLKDLYGTLTMSDYFRIAVAADARIPLKGRKTDYNNARYKGIINWSKYKKYVKNPNQTYMVGTVVQYPQADWDIFYENCLVRGETPKHRLQMFMLDLLMENDLFKKGNQ